MRFVFVRIIAGYKFQRAREPARYTRNFSMAEKSNIYNN